MIVEIDGEFKQRSDDRTTLKPSPSRTTSLRFGRPRAAIIATCRPLGRSRAAITARGDPTTQRSAGHHHGRVSGHEKARRQHRTAAPLRVFCPLRAPCCGLCFTFGADVFTGRGVGFGGCAARETAGGVGRTSRAAAVASGGGCRVACAAQAIVHARCVGCGRGATRSAHPRLRVRA